MIAFEHQCQGKAYGPLEDRTGAPNVQSQCLKIVDLHKTPTKYKF